MADFKTVLTYSRPIDAEIDRSMLESEGIVANLLNRDSSLSGLGGPFLIQLQVSDENLQRASELIRAKHPERFGQGEGIRGAEAALAGGARRFLWFVLSSIALLLLVELFWAPAGAPIDAKLVGADVVLGIFVSIIIWPLYEYARKLTRRG
jgi:hypothetical protein